MINSIRTVLVLKLKHLRRTRSITRLMMPWLHHQAIRSYTGWQHRIDGPCISREQICITIPISVLDDYRDIHFYLFYNYFSLTRVILTGNHLSCEFWQLKEANWWMFPINHWKYLGAFQKRVQTLKSKSFKISMFYANHDFQCMGLVLWKFKNTTWNSTKNIFPIGAGAIKYLSQRIYRTKKTHTMKWVYNSWYVSTIKSLI